MRKYDILYRLYKADEDGDDHEVVIIHRLEGEPYEVTGIEYDDKEKQIILYIDD